MLPKVMSLAHRDLAKGIAYVEATRLLRAIGAEWLGGRAILGVDMLWTVGLKLWN